MTRKILHLDLDAFFCAVEELRNPELRGKAFAVGGRPEERGVVASCSYAARRYGIRSAMPMYRALRLCPHLEIVSSRHKHYSQISRQVMKHLHEMSPLVEQVSIDEAFLDVSDLPEPADALARKLQSKIRQDPGLPCSLGVATNKLMAKIANDVGKASYKGNGPPNAITVVPPGKEAAFLAPLPVDALWGIGPKTAEKLEERGVRTIGDLARWSEVDLTRLFGKNGRDLALRARGIDERSITTTHETKSISQETTFSQDIQDEDVLRRTLWRQSESVGSKLRQENLAGSTVRLKLRWPDFTTITRQITLERATDQDQEIFDAAQDLLQKVWRKGQAVRLIGVGVSGLGPPIRQLSLWDQEFSKDHKLQQAVDELRKRFGKEILQRGLDFESKDEA